MVESRRPDLVVVAGDLTQRAKPHQFREARAFVDRLGAPTLTVPGNHDVPLYRVWERLGSPFGAYRRHFDPELEPIHSSDGLWVAGVNTAHGLTFTGGLFRRRRLRQLGRLLAEAPESACKVVVAHHHLVPPPRFDLQTVSRNSVEAVELFSAAGVELVLSGHHHQGFLASSEAFYPSGRPPVRLVHSGTTTSSRGRGAEAGKNSCNWIEISDRELRVDRLLWAPAEGRFLESGRHRYPRRGHLGLGIESVSTDGNSG